MSSRYYPKFVRGNPQLRIFLPDFPMVLVKMKHEHPKNQVFFKTPVRMTDRDIFNYLERIYKLKVVDVKSQVRFGEIPLAPGSSTEFAPEPAFRLAQVFLPKDVKFEHPDSDLFVADGVKDPVSMLKKQVKELEIMKKASADKQSERGPGVPSWFS